GVVDDNAHAHLGGYLGPLAPTAGVRVTDQFARAVDPVPLTDMPQRPEPLNRVDPAVDRITGHITVPATASEVPYVAAGSSAVNGTGIGWLERVVVDDAEVLAAFDDVDAAGWPAVTRAVRGQGAFWYVATDPDGESRALLLDQV